MCWKSFSRSCCKPLLLLLPWFLSCLGSGFGQQMLVFPLQDGSEFRLACVRFEEVLEGVTPFVLGSVSASTDVVEFGKLLALHAFEAGADGVCIGIPLCLEQNDPNWQQRLARSPYLAADSLYKVAMGVLQMGMYPVLDARAGWDAVILGALEQRGHFPALLVSVGEQGWSELQRMGRTVLREDGTMLSREGNLFRLDWKGMATVRPPQELRLELLRNACVLLKRGSPVNDVVFFDAHEGLDDLPSGTRESRTGILWWGPPPTVSLVNFFAVCTVPTDDPDIREYASGVLKGLQFASGRKNW